MYRPRVRRMKKATPWPLRPAAEHASSPAAAHRWRRPSLMTSSRRLDTCLCVCGGCLDQVLESIEGLRNDDASRRSGQPDSRAGPKSSVQIPDEERPRGSSPAHRLLYSGDHDGWQDFPQTSHFAPWTWFVALHRVGMARTGAPNSCWPQERLQHSTFYMAPAESVRSGRLGGQQPLQAGGSHCWCVSVRTLHRASEDGTKSTQAEAHIIDAICPQL